MRVAVVDYGSGNLTSAARALSRAAEQAGIAAEVTRHRRPGGRGRRPTAWCCRVRARSPTAPPGWRRWTGCGRRSSVSAAAGRPFLGICVGMQLMAERGLEHTVTPGFGWVGGDVAEMAAPGLRLPQMGWNALDFEPGRHPLLDGLQPGDDVYFVHSYALRGARPGEVIATTQYGEAVPAMVAAGNRAGTQFHVEKSQTVGLRILANFLRWSP